MITAPFSTMDWIEESRFLFIGSSFHSDYSRLYILLFKKKMFIKYRVIHTICLNVTLVERTFFRILYCKKLYEIINNRYIVRSTCIVKFIDKSCIYVRLKSRLKCFPFKILHTFLLSRRYYKSSLALDVTNFAPKF